MIPSTVATIQDNSAHGDDAFLTRDLGGNGFLDAVMDGVTGHGGQEASLSVKEALESVTVNSPEDVVAVLEDLNDEFYQVGGGRFLLTTVSAALYLDDRLYVVGAGDSPIYLIKPDSYEQICGRSGRFFHVGVAHTVGAGSDAFKPYEAGHERRVRFQAAAGNRRAKRQCATGRSGRNCTEGRIAGGRRPEG